MRHVIITCKNHTNLRWSCKEIAFDDTYGYNGCRHIFFNGAYTGKPFHDSSGFECERIVNGEVIMECDCSPNDLVRAPEDVLVKV